MSGISAIRNRKHSIGITNTESANKSLKRLSFCIGIAILATSISTLALLRPTSSASILGLAVAIIAGISMMAVPIVYFLVDLIPNPNNNQKNVDFTRVSFKKESISFLDKTGPDEKEETPILHYGW